MAIGSGTVENLVNSSAWRNRSVFLTGHTGFKGSWLALWLQQLGAKTFGFATEPPTQPNMFEVAHVKSTLAADVRADICDREALHRALDAAKPEIVFHLAAQPLVRESYRDPIATLNTNVIGTANLLEAARSISSVRAIVIVTTDKVYRNSGQQKPYLEGDPLGGHDPYSASKAAAELVVSSYRASFFGGPARPINAATARAGNVIGGGDWAAERLVPDCLRAFANEEPVHLRYPHAVRPWQHVLEPLSGYLLLAQRLLESDGSRFATAWNFGPDAGNDASVGEVADLTAKLWGDTARVQHAVSAQHPHEASLLNLDSARARAEIGWRPRWPLEQALTHTVAWHRAWLRGDNMCTISVDQIRDYIATTSL